MEHKCNKIDVCIYKGAPGTARYAKQATAPYPKFHLQNVDMSELRAYKAHSAGVSPGQKVIGGSDMTSPRVSTPPNSAKLPTISDDVTPSSLVT